MPVFKGAMKIARRNLGLIALYVGIIVLVLSMTIQNSTPDQENQFTAASAAISIVDEDHSVLSHALAAHLDRIHTVKSCENNPVSLTEDLYYRQSDFVLRIPAGFGTDPRTHPLQVTEVPGSSAGFYLETQIESYLRQIHLYQTAGFSQEASVSLADEAPSVSVTVLKQSSQSEVSLGAFFQFIPYGALCMLSFVIGNVLCAYTKTEIRKRSEASAMPHRRTALELLAAVAVFGLGVFIVLLLTGTGLYGRAFWTSSHLIFYLLNLAVMILVSMSIAYLIAMVANGANALGGIINSVSLGMSFLCGVFVPLDFLGKNVKFVSQFLPFYWYERAADLCIKNPVLTDGQLLEFAGFLGIQVAFSVAFLSLGATLHKKRNF